MIGNIIFLTKRKEKPYYRKFISYMIAKMTRNKGQRMEDVKVHTAIIYSHNSTLMVREMGKNGDTHLTLNHFILENKDRIEIKINPFPLSDKIKTNFNLRCKLEKVKYDYKNTFFYQIIKSIFNIFVGKDSKYIRMCSEDTQRMYNYINPIFFSPEEVTPNELYNMIKNWKNAIIE